MSRGQQAQVPTRCKGGNKRGRDDVPDRFGSESGSEEAGSPPTSCFSFLSVVIARYFKKGVWGVVHFLMRCMRRKDNKRKQKKKNI